MNLAWYGAIVLSALFLSGCSQVEKWQSSQTEHRAFMVDKKWVRDTTDKTNLGFRKINRMKPVLFKDSIIQANAMDGIAAYNKESGRLIWKLSIPYGVEASATLINDRLFFGALDGQFYSVNASTGKVLWTFPIRLEGLSEPLLQDGNLYLLTGNNVLYALDASNGKQLWLYSRQDTSSLSVRGGSKPAYRNGTLYVGFSDGSVVALLASTGTVKWERQLSRNKKFRDLDSDPLIEGDFLYVLGFDDKAYCLRSATGEPVWQNNDGGYGSLLVNGDLLYYASSNSQFMAVNKETGQKIWSYNIQSGIPTSPALHKGVLLFGESQGSLRMLDAKTGKELGAFQPGRGILSPPTVDAETSSVYFISNEANLFALRFGWGTPKQIPYLR